MSSRRPKKARKTVIRDEWPRIRATEKKGRPLFVVDGRKVGTSLKQRYFADRAQAETHAQELAERFRVEGASGVALPDDLRAFAIAANRILAPMGKTILEAAQFYAQHLEAEERRAASALVSVVAAKWVADKAKKVKHGELAARTLEGIKGGAKILTDQWGKQRIADISRATLETYFDELTAKPQSKENQRNLFGQCFNWAIAKGYAATNPAKGIKFKVSKRDNVTIWNAARASHAMELCEKGHPELVVFCAVSLFAGLRPEEAAGLTWENIHLENREITVLGSTSKPGETHNVRIEDNLAAWLEKYRGEAGPICPTGSTLKRRRKELHAALGYRATVGQRSKRMLMNANASTYDQDVMRHSYASHWLAKYHNRAQLAEFMCNSVEMIRDHYKRVVPKSEMAAYWAIVPKGTKVSAIERFMAGNVRPRAVEA